MSIGVVDYRSFSHPEYNEVLSNNMQDKLTEIESLANGNGKNISRLLKLSHDNDEEVRFRAIEAFENFSAIDSILTRVRESLTDPDELVRTMAVELIGDWKDTGSIRILYSLMSDKSEIVRAAAITSLGQINEKETIWFLQKKYSSLNGLEKLSAAMALYMLGKHEYFDGAIDFLENENYRIRCAAVNLLKEFTKNNDVEKVLLIMKTALLKEESKAVSSSLEGAIRELTR